MAMPTVMTTMMTTMNKISLTSDLESEDDSWESLDKEDPKVQEEIPEQVVKVSKAEEADADGDDDEWDRDDFEVNPLSTEPSTERSTEPTHEALTEAPTEPITDQDTIILLPTQASGNKGGGVKKFGMGGPSGKHRSSANYALQDEYAKGDNFRGICIEPYKETTPTSLRFNKEELFAYVMRIVVDYLQTSGFVTFSQEFIKGQMEYKKIIDSVFKKENSKIKAKIKNNIVVKFFGTFLERLKKYQKAVRIEDKLPVSIKGSRTFKVDDITFQLYICIIYKLKTRDVDNDDASKMLRCLELLAQRDPITLQLLKPGKIW